MRKRKLYLTLGLVLLSALLMVGFHLINTYMNYRIPVVHSERVMNVAVVDNLDFLDGLEKCTSEQNPGVCLGELLLPYTADGTLYLAQDYANPEWVGDLLTDSKDSFLCTLQDDAWENKAESIRNGHVFTIWLVEQECYYELELVVSGMPVMNISTEYSEEQDLGVYEEDPDRFIFDPEVLYFGDVQVFDPGDSTRSYEITEAGLRYYERGAYSASFDKKSYSFSLLDSKGENMDKSLLGMRADNSWKLKAMVSDTRRLREKTACQLWEQFDLTNTAVNEAGPRMEYIEVIKDNDYVGLYGIVEPVDNKKLNLDKNDVLYKSTNWFIPEDADIQYAIDNKWKIMTYFRIRYPDPIADYEKAWYPLRDYLNTFYRGEGDGQLIETKLNLSNCVDMLLFNMAVTGSDNHLRNLYFAADVNQDGTYSMRQIPWDLDTTFGAIKGGAYSYNETLVYEEAAIPYLRNVKPEVVSPLVQQRWQECREGFLQTENILTIIDENQEFLLASGVVARENERWPQYQMSLEIEEMKEYQVRRMEWLDNYFANY